MKRILVTGGAGMIGSNLVKQLLLHDNAEVFVADNLWRGSKKYLEDAAGNSVIDLKNNFFHLDLKNPVSCREIVDGIDEVYHLADIVGGIGYVFQNQAKVFHDNCLIDSNILKASSDARVKKFLYTGTACSYPKKLQSGINSPPLVEENILPAEPESAYGWSKLAGELQTGLYGNEKKMKTGVIRLHNVYGSPADFSPSRSQVIPALIRKVLKYPHEPFTVWGSGFQGRSFIHVNDVAEGMILMMDKGLDRGAIQLGTNRCISIKELAEIIVKISGKDIKIHYDLNKPSGDRGRCADCSRAEKILSWTPKTGLEEGLEKTCEWIKKQLAINRSESSALPVLHPETSDCTSSF